MGLTDYVIMPGADYQAACNAIRAKTGKSDLIKSGDMSAEIEGIGTGGGSDEILTALINRSVTELTVPEGTEAIGRNALAFCDQLTNVILPDSVTSIDNCAFQNCSELALASLPSGLQRIGEYAFYSCYKIGISEIPAEMDSIGYNALSYCHGISSLTFRGTPTSISEAAFEGCSSLTVINVPWAEGAVANAPWGADGAIINYGYTEG